MIPSSSLLPVPWRSYNSCVNRVNGTCADRVEGEGRLSGWLHPTQKTRYGARNPGGEAGAWAFQIILCPTATCQPSSPHPSLICHLRSLFLNFMPDVPNPLSSFAYRQRSGLLPFVIFYLSVGPFPSICSPRRTILFGSIESVTSLCCSPPNHSMMANNLTDRFFENDK